MSLDWTAQLLEQLAWHWDQHVRPRLEGLTDEEYFWEPVDGAWNIRPRPEARTAMAAGAGDLVIDFEFPEPDPPPVIRPGAAGDGRWPPGRPPPPPAATRPRTAAR